LSNTIVGKLKEMLVLESEENGEPAIVAFPKGSIVEVSSEDFYPDSVTDEAIQEALAYLEDCDS